MILSLEKGMHLEGFDMSAQLNRIEQKLDLLLAALAEPDDDDAPTFALDGSPNGGARDGDQPL
jgi:hypothetical protein